MSLTEMSRARKTTDSSGTPTQRESSYDRLLAAIIFADLIPGSTIDEKTLATGMGLGLASVRDALQRLALEGLVERHARIGTRVPDLTLRDVQNVFEARVILEGSCARYAAERASPQDVAEMRAALRDVKKIIAERDFRLLVARDLRFHHALATATGNMILEKQSRLLLNIGARFWFFALPRMDPDALQADMGAHVAVIDAIEKHDAAGAEKAMRDVLGRFPDAMRLFLMRPFTPLELDLDERRQTRRRK